MHVFIYRRTYRPTDLNYKQKQKRRKPPVPWREERPPMGLHSGKNFVTANAVDAILATPANRHLPPVNCLDKEDFGKVPVSSRGAWIGGGGAHVLLA